MMISERSGTVSADVPSYFVFIGMALAVISAILNGMAFVFNKYGIRQTEEQMLQNGITPTPGHHEYLKNKIWWVGMICMILGEILNFVAYSFAPSVLVAPMGSASVLVTALLSSLILKEKLSFDAGIGVALCVLGSIVVVLQSPESQIPVQTIPQFWSFIGRPLTIAYIIVCFIVILILIFWAGPRYGDKNPLIYISIAALGGSFLVQVAGAVGASIVYSFSNWDTDNQFLQWSLYILVIFIAFMAVFQVNFTNRALKYFSAGIVMPMFFVCFTTATLITFLFLFSGAAALPAVQAVTLTVAFLVIVCGVALLYNFNYNLMAVMIPFNLHKTILPGEMDHEDVKAVVEGVDAELYRQDIDPLDITGASTLGPRDVLNYTPPQEPIVRQVTSTDDLPAPLPTIGSIPFPSDSFEGGSPGTNLNSSTSSLPIPTESYTISMPISTKTSTLTPMGFNVNRRMTREDLGGPMTQPNTAHLYKPEHLRRMSYSAASGDLAAKRALNKVISTGGTFDEDLGRDVTGTSNLGVTDKTLPTKMITLVYCIQKKPTMTHEEFHNQLMTIRSRLLIKLKGYGVIQIRQMETIWKPEYLNDSIRLNRGMTNKDPTSNTPIFDAIELISWNCIEELIKPRGIEWQEIGKEMMKQELDFIDWSKSSIWFVEERII